jgi:Tfp pilus assembly ATPase PilU
MLDAFYDKKDPPMSVGTVYSYMDSFKIALASHAVKHEYNYDIEKNDTGRYRVNCAQKNDGCLRRLHASTGKDGHTI